MGETKKWFHKFQDPVKVNEKGGRLDIKFVDRTALTN
jgi:hypothetical protein